jgi:hypothetical protein
MDVNNIQRSVYNGLYQKGALSSGLNCAMPDNAAYTLANDIAIKLGENTSEDSFNNLINYKHGYHLSTIRERFQPIAFDTNKLENEMNNTINELINKQTNSCYTKRTDVVDRVKNFYSELLQAAIEKTGVSAPAAAPAPVPEGGKKKKGGNKSAKKPTKKPTKNLCLKKSTQKKSTKKSTKGKSKCESVKGCKVASGSKRTYCRKAHNKTHKKK